MKKIVLIIAIIFLGLVNLNSQAIKLIRTDVDSVNSNIITATFVFGVDVVIDSLQNCSNVSFQIKYDNSQYIRFSGYRIGDFKKIPSANVYLNPPNSESPTNEQTINVSVFSGLAPGENQFDSPNVLHLEFVVLQSAPINQNVTFSFPKAEATAFVDSVARNIKLKARNIVYKIHSFVDVWPGDANNDGVVNTDDYSAVGLYMRQGADNRNTKTFKRQDASTMWTAQRCILWDDSQATYADADGDGAVTVVDGFIVKLNDGLIKSSANSKRDAIQTNTNDYYNIKPEIESNSIKVPINATLSNNIIAVTGNIYLQEALKYYDFKGIEKGEVLSKIPSSFLINFDKNLKKCEFFITPNSSFDKVKSGNIANVILSPKINATYPSNVSFSNLQGLKANGNLEYLTLSSVDENIQNEIKAIYDNEIIKVSNLPNDTKSVKLFTSNGILVNQINEINSLETTINASNFSTGIYFIIVDNKTLPIIIQK